MTKRLSWAVRLDQAEQRGRFNKVDIRLAESFLTCAIGERHNGKFPTLDAYQSTSPLNHEYVLGMHFFTEVKAQNISEARRIYQEIQSLPNLTKTDENLRTSNA